MIRVGKTERKSRDIKSIDTKKVFDETRCVIHLISMDPEDYEDVITGDTVTEFITDQHMTLWKMMKRGDLIENICESGYRSQGRYIVDTEHSQPDHVKLIKNGLIVRDLYTEYDDYGSIPPHFCTITEFPPNYFEQENIVTNFLLCPNSTASSYWHSDNSPVAFDKKRLKLDRLTSDNVFVVNDKIGYIIIRFKKTNYMICMMNQYLTGPELVESLLQRIKTNELFDIYKVSDRAIKWIAEKENVDLKNIILID